MQRLLHSLSSIGNSNPQSLVPNIHHLFAAFFFCFFCYILIMKKITSAFIIVFAQFFLGFVGFAAYAQQSGNSDFNSWLVAFKSEAVGQGISVKVVDEALAGLYPLEDVIALDRKQPEGTVTLEEYLAKTVAASRIRNGRNELAANRELLDKVAGKYSVPASVIVALWGMETSYGENTGNFGIIESLATLAYEGRRGAFFRTELLNSLKIMEAEKMSKDDFSGSWAGAFGQCQFMPSSYLKYAVDFDGDGKRDIWYTQADVFASIANYLHSEGWNNEEGIEEGNNNFNVLMKWNRSRYFATAIGKLARAIGE